MKKKSISFNGLVNTIVNCCCCCFFNFSVHFVLKNLFWNIFQPIQWYDGTWNDLLFRGFGFPCWYYQSVRNNNTLWRYFYDLFIYFFLFLLIRNLISWVTWSEDIYLPSGANTFWHVGKIHIQHLLVVRCESWKFCQCYDKWYTQCDRHFGCERQQGNIEYKYSEHGHQFTAPLLWCTYCSPTLKQIQRKETLACVNEWLSELLYHY